MYAHPTEINQRGQEVFYAWFEWITTWSLMCKHENGQTLQTDRKPDMLQGDMGPQYSPILFPPSTLPQVTDIFEWACFWCLWVHVHFYHGHLTWCVKHLCTVCTCVKHPCVGVLVCVVLLCIYERGKSVRKQISFSYFFKSRTLTGRGVLISKYRSLSGLKFRLLLSGQRV